MTIILGTGNLGQERSRLPASRDRATDLPLRDNPFGASGGVSSDSTPEDEALIGIYPYSGADIKLVVHLPPEDPRASSRQIDEMEAELSQLEQALEMATTEEELTQAESQLLNARAELENTHALIAVLADGGDIGGVATQEELEADVVLLNTQIEELTGMINTSPRPRDREEMEREIERLSRGIEELRDGVPAPPTSRTKVLAEIQTLSISSHREKYPVRTLGSVFLRSVTRGPRTVSGSIVFTTFHNHIMHEFLESAEYRSTGVGDWDRFRYSSFLMDQIPPLDISISFANEYGNLSWMSVLGVEFMNEGMVMSIEDLFLEGTSQYIARDFDPIRSVANRRLSKTRGVGQDITGTSIMMEDLRQRQTGRNIPWI